LISEDCYHKIEKKDEFHFRYLGQVIVKGKTQATGIYECFDGNPPQEMKFKKQTQLDFEQGINHYFDQKFPAAISSLSEVLKINPKDVAAQKFLDKAQRYLDNPEEGNWIGIERIEEK